MISTLKKYYWAYRNKITNRLFGVVKIPAVGKKKGNILLSFMTQPFTNTPSERFTDPHTNPWVCAEIARLFSVRGYSVDAINWNNDSFIPKKKYVACVDLQQNLERLSPLLGPDCKKVMHIVSSYPGFQNSAEESRIKALEKRKGVSIPMKRPERPSENARFADFLEGYGNSSVHKTFEKFGKKITSIHVPSMETYAFPENKNFEKTKTKFLWFGGGGAVLKGLDLVVEVFSSLPQYELIMVGPASFDKEFEKIYSAELKLPNIKRFRRPETTPSGESMVEGRTLYEIMNECGSIIFPSASEGAGASVVQAMHAGVVPVVTRSSGIDEKAEAYIIEEATVNGVKKMVEKIANTSSKQLEMDARRVWEFARANHTKESFSKTFGNFIDNTLQL